MTAQPVLIALDWGTSSFRGYLLDSKGQPLATRHEPRGILNVPNGDFEQAFGELAGPWLTQYGRLPVLACGMIGSRQGWVEAPYIACPAGAEQIGQRLTRVTTRNGEALSLVPGLSYTDGAGVPDVMRGEETQIVGALTQHDNGTQLFVLPGTHSKWVRVDNNQITWFATFMSGELFAVLREHSILGRLMSDTEDNQNSFLRGVDYAATTNGGLLKRLFSARTLGLFDQLPASGLSDYLSGLIIGSEISEALANLGELGQPLTLIGDPALCQRYAYALQRRGIRCRQANQDSASAGLWRIAQDAGLL